MEIERLTENGGGTSRVVAPGFGDLTAAARSERPAEIVLLRLPCDHRAPAAIRAALSQIEGFGSALGDVMLVASELVTNAVVHSGGSSEDLLTVRATTGREGLMISVRDPGRSGQSAQVRPRDDSEPHGLGLRIVDQLASRWGSERRRGYRVWAELPLPV